MALALDRIGNERTTRQLVWLAERCALPSDDSDHLVIDAPFQRGAVWTLAQKRAWIESILADLPLPAIFVNHFGTSMTPHPVWGHKDVVIDGQQRLRATMGFLNDEFDVRGEVWSKQPAGFRRVFRMNVVVPVISTSYDTERECVELYLKLLTAGTAHTPEEIKKARAFLRTVKS